MTYPQADVTELLMQHTIPVQVDNSEKKNEQFLHKIAHIWTPDLRVVDNQNRELERWGGYLPPMEFMARALTAFGQARLRRKEYDLAEACYLEVLRRFPTSFAAPEAQYYLGVVRYRRDPQSDELLKQWDVLRAKFPASEFRLKQSFKELP